MIRVLHIGLSNQFGGIESFLLNLNRTIDRDAFHFDFIAYCSDVSRGDEFAALGGRIYHLSDRRNPARYAHELYAIMSNDYDAVHIHKNSAADIIPFLCARKVSGLMVVAHAHNTRSGGGQAASALSVFGRRVVLACSQVRLACSVAAGEWLYGSASRIDEVVPNGIDISAYAFNSAVRERVRMELGVGDDLLVGCVGRFKSEKNQVFLAGVLRELGCMGISARVLFLGDGPEMDVVKRKFADVGLYGRALFLGSVCNVADYMQAMDVLAMPSLFEGLPLVAIEAQAAGLPVLFSDVITDEAVLTKDTSRIPLNAGPRAWANALVELTDERRGPSVSEESLLGHFDVRNTAKAMMRIYGMGSTNGSH